MSLSLGVVIQPVVIIFSAVMMGIRMLHVDSVDGVLAYHVLLLRLVNYPTSLLAY